MALTKPEYTKIMKIWLESYLKKKYSKEYDIEVLIPTSNLSKLSNHSLKQIPEYSSFDFNPDLLGILINKNNKKVELVFLNRSISAISLQEIGECICYCRLANPLEAFISSPKGLPTEVNLLLLNDEIQKRLLKYTADSSITIFKWDENSKKVDLKSIFPQKMKKVM